MELNQFTDYALRTLIYVALQEGKRSSIKEIASRFQISENHLVKVVHRLGILGYLDTVRGRGGGVTLAKPAETINLGEVVRAVEPLAVVECLSSEPGHCCLAGVCELQSTLRKATAAFLAVLDDRSLADLVAEEEALKKRLHIRR